MDSVVKTRTEALDAFEKHVSANTELGANYEVTRITGQHPCLWYGAGRTCWFYLISVIADATLIEYMVAYDGSVTEHKRTKIEEKISVETAMAVSAVALGVAVACLLILILILYR